MMVPGKEIGRYRVKRKLAEGGMAEIFLATALGADDFEKEVVIKRIKSFLTGDEAFIEMFKAEARLASRLNHANIVQIFDFAQHEGAYFIAMEYVQGASLWELRKRCRELGVPLPPVMVAEIGAQVARGLAYAHGLNDKGKPLALVHRDVTPHNVLLSFDGAVKLADFGIAKAGTSFTAPGMLKGKFAYMSPEQARGEKVDARTDVFALGVVLWEMLTGGRLFEGDSDVAVLRSVQMSEIAPPSRLNPDVPEELSQVVLKALARPLDQRFQNAQELDRALANFVLRNAASSDDTNIGMFLRHMFREEHESPHSQADIELSPKTESGPKPQPDPGDSYAFGGTMRVDRSKQLASDPGTQQTATPTGSPQPETRAKTAQMPGIRQSRPLALPHAPRPLGPLEDPDDGESKRTDQMQELRGSEKTAPHPALQKKKDGTAPGTPARAPTQTESKPAVELSPSMLDMMQEMNAAVAKGPRHDSEPSAPVQTERDELPRGGGKGPWAIVAAVAGVVVLVGGVALMMGGSQKPSPEAPPKPAVVELPVEKPAEKPVEAPLAVAAPAAVAEPEVAKPSPVEAAPGLPAVPQKPAEVPTEKPAVAEKAEPAAAPTVAKVALTIDAQPFAELTVNGRGFGEVTGKRTLYLPPGTYALGLKHPRGAKSETVKLYAGKPQTVVFRPLSQ